MKKINFKKIKAKNFLCFGKDGVEINFGDYNNIVLIKGKNLDVSKKDQNSSFFSNGVGKSSIPQIIVYGLYGKTIRKPKKVSHKDVINNSIGKELCVEVYWDDYKVERRRKPDSLRLWKSKEGIFDDNTEITLGGMPATQKEIENILGLNYETFVNLFVFTDDNSASFLECDASEKRNIVENLLSLEKYRNYSENAKKINKEHLSKIKDLQLEIDIFENNIKEIKQDLENLKKTKKEWKQNKIKEIKKLKEDLLNSEENLNKIAKSKEYKELESKTKELLCSIEFLQKEINVSQKELEKLEVYNNDFKNKKNELEQEKQQSNLEKQEISSNLNKITKVLEKIKNLEPGVVCDHCFGTIDQKNYDKIKKEHVDLGKEYAKKYKEVENQIEKLEGKIQKLLENIQDNLTKQKSIKDIIFKDNEKIKNNNLKLNELNKDNNDQIKKATLEEKIKIIKESIQKYLNDYENNCPYDEMIDNTDSKILKDTNKIQEKTKEYNDLKILNEYYSFWVIAFGDTGIRKYIIDEIIPALNKNIKYWLNILIDNKLEVSFNNELEETITKYPVDENPFVYDILSNGQRRRINLALSQSFAHVMSLNSGRSPSLVFLDEVTTNIDPSGVEGIYKVICELSEDKQVFVTTHDQYLLELLNGCQEMNLKMKDGISKLIKSS